ncbi:MAG: hypothetical protein IJ572_05790 [Bacilli bacterium]|nr:hypothetical protein [Bacilli bacterium]
MNDENQIPELPKINNEMQQPSNVVTQSNNKEKHTLNEFFKDAFRYITTRNSSDLFALLLRLAIIAGFIIILSLPFQFVRDYGLDLIINLGINFNDKMQNTWYFIWNSLYTIFGIILFFILCKNRYYNLVKSQNNNNVQQ